MNSTNYHIGLAIKRLADEKQCSVETLAKRMGIVRQSVYDTYERESVRKSTVKKYAAALNVTEEEVYRVAGFKTDNSKVPQQVQVEGDSYLMRRLADLEDMVQFLKGQVLEKDSMIQYLRGKQDSVSLARNVLFFIGYINIFGYTI
jgi:transcriptional regulator with XRE-family HTH domain